MPVISPSRPAEHQLSEEVVLHSAIRSNIATSVIDSFYEPIGVTPVSDDLPLTDYVFAFAKMMAENCDIDEEDIARYLWATQDKAPGSKIAIGIVSMSPIEIWRAFHKTKVSCMVILERDLKYEDEKSVEDMEVNQ